MLKRPLNTIHSFIHSFIHSYILYYILYFLLSENLLCVWWDLQEDLPEVLWVQMPQTEACVCRAWAVLWCQVLSQTLDDAWDPVGSALILIECLLNGSWMHLECPLDASGMFFHIGLITSFWCDQEKKSCIMHKHVWPLLNYMLEGYHQNYVNLWKSNTVILCDSRSIWFYEYGSQGISFLIPVSNNKSKHETS